jgi:hypothetical protein
MKNFGKKGKMNQKVKPGFSFNSMTYIVLVLHYFRDMRVGDDIIILHKIKIIYSNEFITNG